MIKNEYVCNGCNENCKLIKTGVLDVRRLNNLYRKDWCSDTNWKQVDYTSISYLQSINQPFGTLPEEAQEALKKHALIECLYGGIWRHDSRKGFDTDFTYRLSADYKEPSKGIEKIHDDTDMERKINELIEAVNKLMEEK